MDTGLNETPARWSVEKIRGGASREEVRSVVETYNCGWAVDTVRDVKPMLIGSRWIDDLCVTKMQFTNIAGARGCDQIKDGDRGYVGFCLLRNGSAMLNGVAPTPRKLDSGNILIWSSLMPIDFLIEDEATFLNILVPEDNIRRLTARQLRTPVIISRSSSAARFASHHMISLAQLASQNEYLQEAYLANATNYILSNFISGFEDEFQALGKKDAIIRLARKYIEDNITDPDLNPKSIAGRLNLSTRYLHKMFEETGLTVMDHVRDMRLTGARRDLANPLLGHLSITEICYKWGFNDSSHFSHLFQKQYGTSARSWRGQRSVTATKMASADMPRQN